MYIPGDGFGIFIDRDQQSFFGSCILKIRSLGVLVTAAVFFGGLLNKCYIFKTVFFRALFDLKLLIFRLL